MGAAAPALAQDDDDEPNAPPPIDDILITGLEVLQTSGTLVVRQLNAGKAVLDKADGSLLTEDVTMTIRSSDRPDDEIVVSCPASRYYFSGEELDLEPGFSKAPTAKEMRAIRRELSASPGDVPSLANPARGDVVLVSPAGGFGVRAAMGDRGGLEAENLVWSARHQRFLTAGPFLQTLRLPEGGTVKTAGGGFATDQAFSEWTYFALDADAIQFDLKGGTP